MFRCAVTIAMALTLVTACSSKSYADVMLSDTVAVNIGGLTQTLTIPESTDETSGESKLIFIWDPLKKQTGPPTTLGFILLCEGVNDCGPKAAKPFTGVSDIFTTGISAATGNNAMFFFSDPFVNPANPNDPTDASALAKMLGLDKFRFLGQVKETGQAQDVSNLFNFGQFNSPRGSFVITSDLDKTPEPSTFLLFATAAAMLGTLGYRQRRKTATVMGHAKKPVIDAQRMQTTIRGVDGGRVPPSVRPFLADVC